MGYWIKYYATKIIVCKISSPLSFWARGAKWGRYTTYRLCPPMTLVIRAFPNLRLPNARMLNIWLNIKNCTMKKIKNRGKSCNSLWIPAFVVYIRAQKVFSLGHIYFSSDKHVPVEFRYTYFTRNVNLTKRENFHTSNLYHKRRNA